MEPRPNSCGAFPQNAKGYCHGKRCDNEDAQRFSLAQGNDVLSTIRCASPVILRGFTGVRRRVTLRPFICKINVGCVFEKTSTRRVPMKHLGRVTVGKAAMDNGPDLAAILSAIFAFVLDIMEIKGKGALA